MAVGEREIIYLSLLYTVTTRMTCIKVGSDESRSVNVSFIVRDKVTRLSTNHNF